MHFHSTSLANSPKLLMLSTRTLMSSLSFCPGPGITSVEASILKALQLSPTIAPEITGARWQWVGLRRQLKFMQDAITAIERCRKPVIAAIQGECRGLGVDIVTACDIRYCSKDAFFSVKEVDMGITADVGTLQRLPGIVGFGNAMELSLTARRFSGEEAKELGLVSRVFGSKVELKEGVRTIAEGIGEKPPLAVVGTKAVLIRSRDVSVEQGLDYVATWNSSMLLSDDLNQAISAYTHKRKPTYAKL
ncbi:delta(3,5)-Delta(2,4)-dienoyl-CoA isomerase, peroxisomal-like isoform X1 [Hibiscus syriacus]|uniref:delta(3,5)-Delta(2,4)-dienoyl-CoA isomerase, peroxisomal-like isoform X1 n=1 Tax=Hibiscus syriacus TaxID=106335 RepID=UPI001920A4D8|nr:delta(3,5)-Delta(2,4)-dienoyl-CoA isomerase, peroxisomal-like isoform X1 [Hibiscus syriacus]